MTPLLPIAAPLLLGAVAACAFGLRPGRGVKPGLLFHSLDCASGLSLSALTSARFRSILAHLFTNGFSATTLEQGQLSHANRQTYLTFDDGCRSFYSSALPILEEFQYKATIFPVAGFLGKSSSWDVLPPFTHLTAGELREISALGHEIGSHGYSHVNLTWLSEADLKKELGDSKKLLEDIIGRPVTSISFPYGYWNDRVWNYAQEAGYQRGTAYRRHLRAAHSSLVPVFGVYRFDTPVFILQRIHRDRYSLPCSLSAACARVMSHFAKGAPMWKFDSRYKIW